MKKIFSLLAFTVLLSANDASALTGSYTVPSPKLPTLKVAIDSLNTYGVTGPVTINLTAGAVNETAPAGGYVLGSIALNTLITTRTSATNSVTINGNNNRITANSGSGSHDAIFTIQGADFITIDKLHLQESSANTTATSMMEHGYSIVKMDNSDGCKTVSVLNSNVTLNTANTTAASGVSHLGSAGIFVGNCTVTSTAALAPPTAISGSHEGLFFFKDSLRSVNHGIYGNGTGVVIDGVAFNDMNTTIQECVISNFTHNGIYLVFFNNDLVKGNKINNMWSGGAAPTTNGIVGIFYNGATIATNNSWTCDGNNIELTHAGSGYATTGIYTQIIGTGTTSITSDTIKLNGTGATSQLIGIWGRNGNGTTTIDKNVIFGFNTLTTNNLNVAGIWNGQTASPVGYPTTSKITNNQINNCSVTGANIFGCVDQNVAHTSPSVFTGNIVSDFTITGNATAFKGYQFRNTITPPTGTTISLTCTDNIFRNISASGMTTPMTIIDPAANITVVGDMSRNRIQKIVAGTGFLTGMQLDFGKTMTMTSDTFINLQGSADVMGYKIGFAGTSVSTVSFAKNLLDSFSSSGTSNTVAAINATTGTSNFLTTATITGSLIRRMLASGTSAIAAGVSTAGSGTTYNINNNEVSDIIASSNTAAYNSSFGLNIQSSGTANVLYNTVNMLSGSTAGVDYGATALIYNPAGTNTIQNNILRTNITAGVANNVSAIRGLSGAPNAAPSLAGFTAASNIYYSPTGANNFLYVEGTTNATLVNGYHQSGLTPVSAKNIVNDTFFNSECNKSSYHKFMQTTSATREKNTFTENNLSGTGGVFAPTGMSYAESAAVDNSVLSDFLAAARAFGASDIGAIEFSGTIRPVMDIKITSSTGMDSACIYNLPTLTGTIPAYFNRVSYQWYKDTTKIPGATSKSVLVGGASANYILKVYDSVTGCLYASEPFKMTIVPLPPAIITYYDSLVFCETGAVVLQANKGPGYTYRWIKNGTLMAGETDDHYVASTSGDYKVEVNTPLGCPSVSLVVRVKVYPLPTPVVYWVRPRVLGVTRKFYTYQWYKNNVKISDTDALGPLYYVPDGGDGAYSVEVTDSNGCTAKSDVYLFSLGVKDQVLASSIRIFPNPVTDILNIESPVAVTATVSDLTGRQVIRQDDAKSIRLGGLAEGVYLLSISDREGNLIRMEKISKVR